MAYNRPAQSRTNSLPAQGVNMPQIDRELNEVWNALRASRGRRDEALEEVRITNLRAIEHLRISFDYPVSVLAGPSGSGKSTVLFACACAYRAPGRRAGYFAPGRLFPNFSSEQEAVRSDPAPQTELDFYYLHDGDRHSMLWKRGEKWRRSGSSFPQRDVYLRTLANLTSPSEVRSILQLGKKQVEREQISSDLLIFAHRILPWRYRNVDLIRGRSSRDLLFAEIDGANETRYSEFHMSSGERTIVRTSKDISGLENALVLIDEVDTGMHPYTQQQAMLELQRSALRQKLQIIVASHSPVILDSVPPEGRIFLDRDREGHVRREPLYRDIFQKALYGQSQDRLSILCEDTVAEGLIRGVLDVLNVKLGLRHEDIFVGRNTGKGEFPGHIRTLSKFHKLADFIVVLDGDSRAMENALSAVAKEYGHSLEPIFLPGDASPEKWLWDMLEARPNEYAMSFGLQGDDMRTLMGQSAALVEGAVQQQDSAKAALGTFAEDIQRTVPDIARIVGRSEAERNAIPELLQALKDQIGRWRSF